MAHAAVRATSERPISRKAVPPNASEGPLSLKSGSGRVRRLVLIGLFANMCDDAGRPILDDPHAFPAELRPFARVSVFASGVSGAQRRVSGA